MAVDIKNKRPVLANVVGGLSGPAIKPVALRMVWQICQRVKIPVIGIGGISTLSDVIEFLLVGASAVQIGTANYLDPMVAKRLIGELEKYCRENGLNSIEDIKGKLEV
jgi:dihydroorotate dehydrogenase (NAD+) catalytic subunit